MVETFANLDHAVTGFIITHIPHNVFFNILFSFLSLKGNSLIVWVMALGILFLFEERRNKFFVTYFLLSFATTYVLNNWILKSLFARHRPFPVFTHNYAFGCPSDFSFPSGHAAGAFSAAVIFAHFDPKRRWLYYSIASLVGFSRIYLGCHYFFDVVGGAVVGSVVGLLFLQMHVRWNLLGRLWPVEKKKSKS